MYCWPARAQTKAWQYKARKAKPSSMTFLRSLDPTPPHPAPERPPAPLRARTLLPSLLPSAVPRSIVDGALIQAVVGAETRDDSDFMVESVRIQPAFRLPRYRFDTTLKQYE